MYVLKILIKYYYLIDTFKAFDHDNDNKISRKEFLEFYCESWMAAFRILAEKLQKEKNESINLSLINNWASAHLKEVREYMDGVFSGLDKMRKGVNFLKFFLH